MPVWRAEEPGRGEPLPCPQAVEAPWYVQGRLSVEALMRFEAHLERCAACRDEVRGAEEVLTALQDRSPKSRDVDLLPRLLTRIEAEGASWPGRRVVHVAPWAALAAALLAAAWIGLTQRESIAPQKVPGAPAARAPEAEAREPSEARVALELALEWLLRAQEPDGGFRAARWGGQSRFDVGLTSLAALAFLNGREEDAGSPESERRLEAAAARALRFLLRSQSSEGRFGPDFAAALYNHGIATLAFLEAHGSRAQPEFRGAIEHALGFLRRTQSAEGGWGYLGDPAGGPNTAATCWPLQAVILARALGFPGHDGTIEAGLKYLADVSDPSGRLGYRRPGEFPYGAEALSFMGGLCVILARDRTVFPHSLRGRLLDGLARAGAQSAAGGDLYRDFVLTAALEAQDSSPAGRWALAARRALAARQVRTGLHLGSWEPRDVWSPAGGRLYSTAFAALILESRTRGQRLVRWLGA